MSAILAFQKPPGKPILRGQEHYWAVILDLDKGGPWTVNDVFMRSNVRDRGTVSDFVRRLLAGGIAEKLAAEPNDTRARAGRYRLLSKPVRCPRLRRDGTPASGGRGQVQMWNVMRGPVGRDGFTFHDLVVYASTDDVAIAVETAKAYVHRLAHAGYLMELQPSAPGKATIWRLKPAMNTGPKPPLILRTQIVFDQNRMEAVGQAEAEEVDL